MVFVREWGEDDGVADVIEVTVEEAEAEFERLMDAVARGERVVIVRGGEAVAALMPVHEG